MKYPLNIRHLVGIFVKTKLWVGRIHGLEGVKRFRRYLGGEVANVVLNKYGAIDYEWGIKSASTDFVRCLLYLITSANSFFEHRDMFLMVCSCHVDLNDWYSCYDAALPSLHPGFGAFLYFSSSFDNYL